MSFVRYLGIKRLCQGGETGSSFQCREETQEDVVWRSARDVEGGVSSKGFSLTELR